MHKILLPLTFFLAIAGYGRDSLFTSLSGDTLTIHHQQTERNCGALFTFDVSILENTITVTEVDTGEQVWCTCYFDLSVSITGLDPGNYEVEVWGHDMGQDPVLYGSIDVTIGGLGLVDQWESECLDTREDTSFIDLSVYADTLDIFWDTPLLNCALEPAWEGWLSMDTFHVSMVDTGMPADCVCPFELRTRFGSFQPGSYVLDFWEGEYGYPHFEILGLRSTPTLVSNYQSPCYDPVSIVDQDIISVPEKVLMDVTCYPNPFNPNAKITYTLTSPQSVSLKIYDLRGSLQSELDQGRQSIGPHSIHISSQRMKSGAYLYVLETTEFKVVKKLVILK